jgi:hypothetical protein
MQGKVDESRPYVLEQLEDLRRRAEPVHSSAPTCNDYAWKLLTALPKDVHDPATALHMARRAVEKSGGEEPLHWDTLALAFFENGDLDGALLVQERALTLAIAQQSPRLPQLKEAYFRYLREKGAYRTMLRIIWTELTEKRKSILSRPTSSSP